MQLISNRMQCVATLGELFWQAENWTEPITITWCAEIEPHLPHTACETENVA